MRLLFALMFLFLISNISISQTESVYKQVDKFDPERNPQEDLSNAVSEAKKSGKRIILDVGGDWCIWCHRIDHFIETTEEVKNYLDKNFIVLKINFSKENKNEDFLSKYPEIPGYPHFFVLDSDGKLLHSQDTGDLEAGKGYSKEKIMSFLKKWAPSM